jgi:ceramide glucosyltransferase
VTALQTAAAIVCALWALAEALRQIAARRALRAMPQAPTDDDDDPTRFAGIDVLQPIRSGDLTLGEALAASLRALGGRGARLHWLIDEDDPLAARIVAATLGAQPALRAQVAVSLHPPCPPAVNPKLFKLDRALQDPALAHDAGATVLVLDDDARLPPATLDALCAALDTADGPIIATALPVYLPAPGLASRLLARFVNDGAAITYLPPRLGGRSPSINGMCWAMRTDALRAIGGFAPHLRKLTDDLAMAQAVLAAGGRIEQRREPVWMRTALADGAAYLRQMHRWMLFARLLLHAQPPAMRLRIALEQGLPTLLPLLSTALLIAAPSLVAAIAAGTAALLHVVGRRALQRACAGAATPLQPLTSLLVALLLPLHLLHAWLDPRIRWRTHRYRVRSDGSFEEHAVEKHAVEKHAPEEHAREEHAREELP